jgi:hypothetical protein
VLALAVPFEAFVWTQFFIPYVPFTRSFALGCALYLIALGFSAAREAVRGLQERWMRVLCMLALLPILFLVLLIVTARLNPDDALGRANGLVSILVGLITGVLIGPRRKTNVRH